MIAKMPNVTLTLQGEALTVTLPDDVRSQLGLEPGQEMAITVTSDGLHLTRLDAELDRQLKLVDQVLTNQADVLRALASR